jgi:hypothetical protein
MTVFFTSNFGLHLNNEGMQMKIFDSYSKRLIWLSALLLTAVVAGCGGNGQGRGPILGSGNVVFVPPAGAILPGAACVVASGPTVPTVTQSDPTPGNQFVTTSTNGVANGGKAITATFSLAMNPASINATTFVVAPAGGAALIPASVTYNASTKVATLTTNAALLPGTTYTAVIQGSVTSATGTPIGCNYVWNFKTVTPAKTGLAQVNLGLAAPFGIAATAGITNTNTLPLTTINGNVVVTATPTCNGTAIPGGNGSIGMGGCGNTAPTSIPILNGTAITPTSPDTTTANAIMADLNAAFISITPPAGPPAAGKLGGGIPIAAPTTMGDLTGTFVVGKSLFYPGVYISNTSIMITNDLTLDAQGDPNAVFVFQSASTVGSAAGAAPPGGVHTRILLVNGAKASNVWWQAGTSATLGAYSEWQGNILASATVSMVKGATSCGRLLAGAFTAGQFTFDANVVSVPGNLNAPASCQ